MVEIHSLENSKDLNGLEGFILSDELENGRYAVELKDKRKISIKPSNLKLKERPDQSSDQEKDTTSNNESSEQTEEEKLPEKIYPNRTSIFLTRSTDDSWGSGECAYCGAKRVGIDPETNEESTETDLKNYSMAFTSTKMTVNDMELLFNTGFTRCGTYMYQKQHKQSCCEVWQYCVKAKDFVITQS